MRISRIFPFLLVASVSTGSMMFSQTRTGSGEAAFFDSTAWSDGVRISMTGVSNPNPGKVYVAWLGADDDVQYTKLGQLTVQGSGDVLFIYRDNIQTNLLSSHKKFIITEETSPFSGNTPDLSSLVFADSLHGPGTPSSTSPLRLLRNCLVDFPNTAQGFGLSLWFKEKIHKKNYTDHLGFAVAGMLGNDVPNARIHTDHVFDFILGRLTGNVGGNTSVADNSDPVGYGYRRYADVGTMDSTLGGAGFRGGAGYQVGLILDDPSASPQMKKAGERALRALRNAFGASNDSGWARQLTERSLNIINGVYVNPGGTLPGEAAPYNSLAMQFMNGSVGVNDTGAATGGVTQAYYHIQRMATFILDAPIQPVSVERLSSIMPDGFELTQNFPNPFNGITNILFKLPGQSRVSLEVFNLLGQRVSLILDNVVMSRGTYSAQWESGSLGSGTYLYRMDATMIATGDPFSFSRQMTLLK